MILLLLEEKEEQKHDALAVFAAQVVVVILYIYIYACVRQVNPILYNNNGEMCKTYLKLLRISRLKKGQPNASFTKNKKKKIIICDHTCEIFFTLF